MRNLLFVLISALVVPNLSAAATNAVVNPAGAAVKTADTNHPVEAEFQKLMEADDAAQAEVDRWIRDNQAFAAKGAGEADADLNKRILARFDLVRKGYDDFLTRHTNHARAELAYAGFLNDIREEEAAVPHMEKSLLLDPKNPAVWNNLANYYGHYGEVKKAFEYYGKALELNPNESLYYHNFGTTVYLFRKDAKEFYNLNEQQVFDKALELYAQAIKIDPQDFPLATDVAQTYYGIKPLRADDALKAWTNAFNLAHDEIERDGVRIHFARVNFLAGRTNESRAYLNSITNEMYTEVKQRIMRNLDRPPDAETKHTNAPPSAPDKSSGK